MYRAATNNYFHFGIIGCLFSQLNDALFVNSVRCSHNYPKPKMTSAQCLSKLLKTNKIYKKIIKSKAANPHIWEDGNGGKCLVFLHEKLLNHY